MGEPPAGGGLQCSPLGGTTASCTLSPTRTRTRTQLHQDVGTFTGVYEAEVQPHDVVMLRVTRNA